MDVSWGGGGISRESVRTRASGVAETCRNQQYGTECLPASLRLRTSGFESLFSDSHCWKTALAQAEFNGEPPDQNCLDQSGQQKRQKRSENSNQPSQNGHRISKTTVKSHIKQSRGLKAYWKSQKPKISEK